MQGFRNTKLISLVEKLSRKDFNKLIVFLNCRYLNSNKKLPAFLEAIWKYYPKFDNNKFTAKNIYKKIYPGEGFNLDKFTRLKTDLMSRILHFLALEELETKAGLKAELTNSKLARMGYYRTFRIAAEARIREIEKKKGAMGFQDLLDLLCTNHSLFFHPQTIHETDLAASYMSASMDYLDCFYFFSKIVYSAELLSLGRVKKRDDKIKLLDKAITLGRETLLKDNVLFILYTHAVELLKSENESNFENLRLHLFRNSGKISDEGKLMSINILTNYAIAQYSKGDASSRVILLELYKFRDKEALFLREGIISRHTFTNVVVVAAALKDFKWVNYFLNKYTGFIRESLREDTLKLSKAFQYFHQGNYDLTLKLLVTISGNDFGITLRVRSLYIRAYYELSLTEPPYVESTLNEIEKFKNHLKRENLHMNRKTAYENFCKICLALLNAKPRAEILGKIDEMKLLMFKVWLLEKTNALK